MNNTLNLLIKDFYVLPNKYQRTMGLHKNANLQNKLTHRNKEYRS